MAGKTGQIEVHGYESSSLNPTKHTIAKQERAEVNTSALSSLFVQRLFDFDFDMLALGLFGFGQPYLEYPVLEAG